jgi:uncharacterized Fe-S center protein
MLSVLVADSVLQFVSMILQGLCGKILLKQSVSDCWGFNDYPLVPDLGIAASFDPVAIDQACADLVKAAPALPGSRICDDHKHSDMKGEDKFKKAHPDAFWQAGLEHGVKIGLGNTDYELINIP